MLSRSNFNPVTLTGLPTTFSRAARGNVLPCSESFIAVNSSFKYSFAIEGNVLSPYSFFSGLKLPPFNSSATS